MNRRYFCSAAALTPFAVFSQLPVLAQPVTAVLPRENIATFSTSPAKLEQLRKAVTILSARPLDDASSWFNMAAIHGIPEMDPNAARVPIAVRQLWSQCHNDESLFFVWHRAYVSAMERLMQAAVNDASFRLPYWDWYTSPALPDAFQREFVDGAKKVKNALYVKNRNPGVNEGKPIWRPRIRADFQTGDFYEFQSSLNFAEHGDIHVAIGNDSNMGHPDTAARDPIFWLHHCNIDRLLPVWLKLDPAVHRVPTAFPAWDSTLYRFPTPLSKISTPTANELALGSMSALGYEYAETGAPSLRPTTPPAPPTIVGSGGGVQGGVRPMGNRFESISAKKSVEVGSAGTVELSIGSAHSTKLNALGNDGVSGQDGFTSLAVVLDGIAIKNLPSGVLSYSVYLNLPSNAKDAMFENHYLGSISLFALRHKPHHGENAAAQLRFSVLEKIKRQMRGKSRSTSSVSISLVPELAPEAVSPSQPVITIKEIRVEASTAPIQ